MKTIYTITAAAILAGLSSATSADFYTQNFDGMGTTGTTAPAGWSVRYLVGNGLNAELPTSAELAGSSAGSSILAIWNQTTAPAMWLNQAANMGASPTAPNRLLGTSPTGTRGSLIQLSLNNNSGVPVYKVELTYDMQNMATGVLNPAFDPSSVEELLGYSFYYLDGAVWTRVPSLDLGSSGTATAIFNYFTPVANGANMQFRWFDDNAYAYSPDTIHAIDNIIVNIPEPATWSLFAIGALALISRRRKA